MRQANQILDNISTGVIALDEDLQVMDINSSAQALLELSRCRILNAHAGDLILDNEPWLSSLQQAALTGALLTRRSMPLTLLNGRQIHVDLIITPLSWDNGETRLLAELQAVDRLLRISREDSLLQTQETTRAMLRGLAHEIKNPLGGVRGAAQLLARELPGSELNEYTRVIIREADRLRDLVDRLLGPHDRIELETLNIHRVLEHVRKLIEAEADGAVAVRRNYDPSLPDLAGDQAQLVQAFLNIMSNAMQAGAGSPGARITVTTRARRQFTIGNTRHRLVCQVEINDNGPGVAPELLDSIFVPMVTGRPEGSGLGLSIAQSVINRHGGLLQCDSRPGDTTFTAYLPMETTP